MTLSVAYLSTYVPKKCGLATYTHHLRSHIRAVAGGRIRDQVVAVIGPEESSACYGPGIGTLRREAVQDYEDWARRINDSDADLVLLQHEFGIFGGEAGSHILRFARALEKPLVTTLHTVFRNPGPPYRDIQAELLDLSTEIIVLNRWAVDYLRNSFGTDPRRVRFIPHGAPGPASDPRPDLRRRLGWADRRVVLTFGLIGPGKGIESVLDALPEVVRAVPEVTYVIAGQTHPEVVRREGEAYRDRLAAMVRDRGLDSHVVMIDRYLSESDIQDLITATDLLVTPYPGMEQISSGALAYGVGAGTLVLTTPYAYARDLLADLPELMIAYGDRAAWAAAMIRFLQNETEAERYRARIEAIGRGLRWPEVAARHLASFSALAERGRDTLVVAR